MGFYCGDKNLTLFWGSGHADGTSNVRLYLGEKLVYMPFRPPEGDLLMAGKGTYLRSSLEGYLSYKNAPQVLQDTLSGREIGKTPFEVAFDVRRGAIGAGTAFLLGVPGVMQVKAEQNTLFFKFPWDSDDAWKYVPSETLADGWNRVALKGDGAKITVSVGESVFVLVDASTSKEIKSCYLSGFSAGNYLQLKEPFAFSGQYQMIFNVTPDSVTTTQPVAACNNRDRTVYLQGASGCIAFYDGSSVVGKTKLAAGEKYWVALAWDGNASKVYLAKDDNTLLPEELPALEDAFWSLEASAAGRELFAGNAFRLGQNGGTNTYWRGELDILKTRITVDGETTMFGSNWGNVFQTVGTLSKNEESVFVGPAYPSLPASRLEVFADWGKIRNIQAVLQGE